MHLSYIGWIGFKGLAEKILGNPGNTFVILTMYFAFVLIRFVVSLLFQYPLTGSDELSYKSMALSYFLTGSFHDFARLGYPPTRIPNMLYPLLISPSFWFGENFHTAIKLINSLLMNSAIFPLYLLAREFLNKQNTLIICFVVLTLPFFNLTTFVMVESLTLPLFLTCFYLAFKSISTRRLKYAVLTGLFLVISFFCKTTALLSGLAMVISCFVLMMLYRKRLLYGGIRPVMVSIAVLLCCSLIAYLLLQHFLIGSDYFSMTGRTIGNLSFKFITIPPLGEVIQMSLAHLDTILLTYLIPFWVMILMLVGARRSQFFKDMNKYSIFAIMLPSFFVVYLIGVIKLCISIYYFQHFQELPGRFYFMVFPLLVVGFATFLPLLEWTVRERTTLLITGVIIILASIYFFLPKYVSQGAIYAGNPDLAWYGPPNKLLVIPITIIFILTVLYYAISARPARSVFLCGLFCYALIGNLGEIRALIFADSYNVREFKPNIDFIGWQLPQKNSSVVVIGSSIADRTFLAFWKTYNYVALYDLPKGAKINRQSIPASADFLILFDEYELDFPVGSAVTKGRCKIIALHDSVDAFKKGFPYRFGDTLTFSEGGNYIRYIESGWCSPEAGLVWSNGPVARLHIPLELSSDSDLMLRVKCTPFVTPPNLTYQRVRVLVGGNECCNWTIPIKGEYECLIPASAIKDSVLDLAFEFPDAASPKDYNLSNDNRKLAVAFHSAIILKSDKISADLEYQFMASLSAKMTKRNR